LRVFNLMFISLIVSVILGITPAATILAEPVIQPKDKQPKTVKDLASDTEATILVTVPALGMLIKDIYGDQVTVKVISEQLDYHMPQYSLQNLRSWLKADILVWMGPTLEPQFIPLIKKLDASGSLQLVSLDQTNSLTHHHHSDHKHHDAGHAHPDAHAWLDLELMVAWSKLLEEKFSPQLEPLNKGWFVSLEQQLAKLSTVWKSKFQGLDNLSLVQEHAVFDDFLKEFGVNVLGSLSTQHDVSVSIEQLNTLSTLIREHGTRCFIAMPGSKASYPQSLFSQQPLVQKVDPFGRSQWSQGASLLNYYETTLSQVYSCLKQGQN